MEVLCGEDHLEINKVLTASRRSPNSPTPRYFPNGALAVLSGCALNVFRRRFKFSTIILPVHPVKLMDDIVDDFHGCKFVCNWKHWILKTEIKNQIISARNVANCTVFQSKNAECEEIHQVV